MGVSGREATRELESTHGGGECRAGGPEKLGKVWGEAAELHPSAGRVISVEVSVSR